MTLEEIAAKLRYGLVRHDVGPNDEDICSFCGQIGQGDEGRFHDIKHWPHCPAALYDKWKEAQG